MVALTTAEKLKRLEQATLTPAADTFMALRHTAGEPVSIGFADTFAAERNNRACTYCPTCRTGLYYGKPFAKDLPDLLQCPVCFTIHTV